MKRKATKALFGITAVGAALLIAVLAKPTPNVAAGTAEPEPPAHKPLVQRDHFKPYPAGPGAQTRADLNELERQALDGIKTYMSSPKHGAAVHEAWSRGTRARLDYHKRRMAERASGLTGAAELGVE